jgi:hypothetical protein
MNGNGELTFYTKNSDEIVHAKLRGHFQSGYLLSNETNPAQLIIYTTEKEGEKIQPTDMKFKILNFQDNWSISYNYICNATLQSLKSGEKTSWDGSKTNSKTEIGFESSLENLKKFELFWLTKSLLVPRENVPIYQLTSVTKKSEL